jgi:hypothetical protein
MEGREAAQYASAIAPYDAHTSAGANPTPRWYFLREL